VQPPIRESFRAEVSSLSFDRIGVPDGTAPAEHLDLLGTVLDDPSHWRPGEAVLAPGWRPVPCLVRQPD
jgi:hypothetical protein